MEKEMIICSKCQISLYEKRKQSEAARSDTLLLDEPEDSVDVNQGNNSIFNSLINLKGFYGDDNDEAYCSCCLKSITE